MTITDEATTDVEARLALASERAAALRALADLIESKPDLAGDPYSTVAHYIFPKTASEMAGLVRLLGGDRSKLDQGRYLTVQRDLGAGVLLNISGERGQVCEAVVVGTETVEIADPAAPKVTVERDVIEWRCAPVLGIV